MVENAVQVQCSPIKKSWLRRAGREETCLSFKHSSLASLLSPSRRRADGRKSQCSVEGNFWKQKCQTTAGETALKEAKVDFSTKKHYFMTIRRIRKVKLKPGAHFFHDYSPYFPLHRRQKDFTSYF